MVTNFVRAKEGGLSVVNKQEFNTYKTTVQDALDSITGLVNSSGSGFISIGNEDGYATGSYNVGSASYPTLKSAFEAAVADERLTNGGVILLMAGTYKTSETITIPAGISVVGEVGGTLIIGEMSEQPIFLVQKSSQNFKIGGNDTSLDQGSNVKVTKIYNLMLSDNLNGAVASGGPSMATVPMIRVENASNVICERVSFLGRLADGTVTNRLKTLCAIKNISSDSTAGTVLTIRECFMDGLKIGIDFQPGVGDTDFLTVENTKARLYGSDGGNTTVSNNCFILSSLCNAKISNNFAFMAGASSHYFLNFTSAISTANIFCTITGNSGKPFNDIDSTSTTKNEFITNDSGVTFRCTSYGNNWGHSIGNPWSIVVGGADTNSPIGDIFGPNAINVVLSMASNNYDVITCIVNPGTYTVNGGASSSSNYSNIKFIGNKRGRNYPVFNLDITNTSNDFLSQRHLKLGNRIESIYFNSLNRFHSVHSNFSFSDTKVSQDAHTLDVVDCVFVNTTLFTSRASSANLTDQNSKKAQTTVNVENCHFFQDGTFSDSIALCIPPQNNVLVKGCNVIGKGYAVNAGTIFATSTNIANANYVFENCTFDQTGYTISNLRPGSTGLSNYFGFVDKNCKLTLRNCQILSTNLFKGSAPFDSSILGSINAYNNITASEIVIDGCTFSGPDQTIGSSTLTAMPTLRLTPYLSCIISNSKFLGGALPAQVYSTNTFASASEGGNALIDIHNCEFRNHSGSDGTAGLGSAFAGKGYTLLDIEVNITSFAIYGTLPKINVSNNVFNSLISNEVTAGGVADTPYSPAHATAESYYNALGMVQIYAAHCNINFSNNTVYANRIMNLVNNASSNNFIHYSMVAINNYNFPGGGSNRLTSVNVEGNHIMGQNKYTLAWTAASASALWVKAPMSRVHGNLLALKNLVTPLEQNPGAPHFIGSLYIDAQAVGGASDAVVQGNTISRKNIFGTSGTGSANGNSLGYVYIPSTSETGIITNNIFSDSTLDGTKTELISDNTVSANKWLVRDNRNQIETVELLSADFQFSILDSSGYLEVTGNHSAAPNCRIVSVSTFGTTFSFVYGNTGVSEDFYASVALFKLIPVGAEITKIVYDYLYTVSAVSTKSLGLTLASTLGSKTESTAAPADSGTVTLTSFSTPMRNTHGNNLYLYLTANINHSAATELRISNFKVTYKY